MNNIDKTSSGNYTIRKYKNGKTYSFGSYETLERAIEMRDYFEAKGWPIDERFKYSTSYREPPKECPVHHKHIYYNGYSYTIQKWMDGTNVNFGSYPTLSEAKKMVEYFQRKGWRNCLHERSCYSNVSNIVFDNRSEKFIIKKMINGELIDFGRFNTFEDAEAEVKLLKECNWCLDAICEGIDETIDGKSHYLKNSVMMR